MDVVDLLAPSAAILAIFVAIGLVVQSIRQGRAIRRLEERLAERGDAAAEASLQRVAQLQARAQVSSGDGGAGPLGRDGVRTGLAVLGVVVVLLLAAGGVWFAFLRDDGASAGSAADAPTTEQAQAAPKAPPRDTTVVPDEVPPLADKGLYTVTIFNASGVTNAAAGRTRPRVEGEGYQIGLVDDEPKGTTDLARSQVMYAEGARRVGVNLAKDLGIRRSAPVDGYTTEEIGDADAVVLVGLDLANP